MNYNLHLNLWNIAIAISTVVGITFGFLLIFTQRKNKVANRFMAAVIMIMSLWLTWVYMGDMKVLDYFPRLTWFPITTYLLIIGPLLYFYVNKIAFPEESFKKKQLLHFSPIIAEFLFHAFLVSESYHSGIVIHRTYTFDLISPFFQLAAIISVAVYVIYAIKKIKAFNALLVINHSNGEKYKLTWLQRVITFFGIMWMLWLPYTFIDYLFFDYHLNFKYYYPLYLVMGIVSVWMGMEAFLRPEYILVHIASLKEKKTKIGAPPLEDLKDKIIWLKNEMEQNLFFLNPELTLNSLSESLHIHPNILSRIVNEGTGQNFSDFVNEYRVNTVIEKIANPLYKNITLLGIAHESGFNSKTSFYRTFKKFTNKTPSEYLKSK